jgi:hypothetical protein
MLGGLVQDGRRFVALADQQIGDMSNEMPVGTTVAVIERGMKVMSAIHKRLHYAQKTEFRLLARIFAENLPPMYPYAVAGAPSQVKAQDFDGRVDVLPVSDPNIFSMAQRVTLAQTQLQLAQSNPQMHNLHAAYRRMYQALEVQNIDEILPPMPKPQPQDPASENAAMIAGKTPQAYPQQDHDAHIAAHISLLALSILQQTPAVLAALFSHVLQHVNMKARTIVQGEIQQQQAQQAALMQVGAQPPMMQPMAPDMVEARVAQVETQLLQEVMPLLTYKGQDGQEQDPLVNIRMQELAIKQMESQQKASLDQAKLELEQMKMEQQATTDSARLELQEQIADERNEVNRERIDVQRDAVARRGYR